MLKEALVDYDSTTGRTHSPPRHVFLELSSHCNLACVHCSKDFGSDEGYPTRHMSPETLERVLPWVHGARFVNLNMVGESMLSPHYDRALARCSEGGAELSINTNGLLMTDRRCDELVARGVHSVTVSIDGTDANRAIRGVSYGRLRGRVIALAAARERAGSDLPHIALACTLMRRTLPELPALLADLLPRARIHAVHLQPLVVFYEALRAENVYGAPELGPVLERCRRTAERHGTRLVLFRSNLDGDERRHPGRDGAGQLGEVSPRYGCIDPFYEIKIRSDGTVMSCSYGREGGFDVNVHGLDEIWNGPWYRRLRRDLHAGRFRGECSRCPYVFGCLENQLDHVRPGVRHSREHRLAAAPSSGG